MISASEAVGKWRVELKTEATQKYCSQKRTEYLESLIAIFVEYQVSFESAKQQKKKVVEILTTKDGRKGVGKHKGWTENIEDEYITILTETYKNESLQSKDISDDSVFDWLKETLEMEYTKQDLKEMFFDWKNKKLTTPSLDEIIIECTEDADEEDYENSSYLNNIEQEEEQIIYPDPFDFPEEVVIYGPGDDPDRPASIDRDTWEWLKNAEPNPPLNKQKR